MALARAENSASDSNIVEAMAPAMDRVRLPHSESKKNSCDRSPSVAQAAVWEERRAGGSGLKFFQQLISRFVGPFAMTMSFPRDSRGSALFAENVAARLPGVEGTFIIVAIDRSPASQK